MFTEAITYPNITTSSSNVVATYYDKPFLKRLGDAIKFSKLGDLMPYTESEPHSTDSPLKAELNTLKYDILNAQRSIKHQQAMLLIARTKLAAVKKLAK